MNIKINFERYNQFNDVVCQLFSNYDKLIGGTISWLNSLSLFRTFVGLW